MGLHNTISFKRGSREEKSGFKSRHLYSPTWSNSWSSAVLYLVRSVSLIIFTIVQILTNVASRAWEDIGN